MTTCSKSSALITYDEKVRMVRTKAVCQGQQLLLRESMTKQTSYEDSSVVQLVIRVPWLCLVGSRARNKWVEILWSGCDRAWYRGRLIGKGSIKAIRLRQSPKIQRRWTFKFSVLLLSVAQCVWERVKRAPILQRREDLEDWRRLTPITLSRRRQQ